jgi:hypothetical protein
MARLAAEVTTRIAISVLRASMITVRSRIAAGHATLADLPAVIAQAFAIAGDGWAAPRR